MIPATTWTESESARLHEISATGPLAPTAAKAISPIRRKMETMRERTGILSERFLWCSGRPVSLWIGMSRFWMQNKKVVRGEGRKGEEGVC